MSPLKVYLAGPMRGYAAFNFPAFDFAAERLRAQGFEVFSPAERDRDVHGDAIEKNETGNEDEAASNVGFSLREALEADWVWIARNANIVALMPGWEKSEGAQSEKQCARALGLSVMELGKEYVRPK